MRTYLSKESYSKIYDVIEELIENDSLWEDHNNTQKITSDGSHGRESVSFLEIIRKENDELRQRIIHLEQASQTQSKTISDLKEKLKHPAKTILSKVLK